MNLQITTVHGSAENQFVGTPSPVLPPEQFEAIQSQIEATVMKGEISSISIAVAQNGKIIWEEAFGWADRKRMIGATPDTIYPVASLSKSITATGLVILAERGLINFEEPVEKYMGATPLTVFRGRTSDLKVSHILNMVSVVSQRSFSDFMRTELLLPLGMSHTSLGVNPELETYTAVGYDHNSQRVQHIHFGPEGAAGFYSSAHDLIRYGMFHLKNRLRDQKPILKDATLDATHEEKDAHAPNKMYANGWGVIKTGDGRVSLLSNGAIKGGAASLLLVPSENLAIVCLNNGSTGNEVTDQTVFQIAGTLIPEFDENLKKLIAEVELQSAGQPYEPTPQFIGRWQGEIKTYEGSIPVTIVFDQNGEVRVKLKGQSETVLNEVVFSEGVFSEGVLNEQFCGNITTEEAMKRNHHIKLELRREGSELYGVARAESDSKRPGFGLPSFICLKKVKES